MADHQHVEMLLERVHGVGPRRVGRGRDDVRQARDLDDVGRVAAAGALGVEGVDGAPGDGARWCPRRSRNSFSVSVWIITCTSIASATRRQQSIAAGVVPQSSCSFSAQAPARTISSSAAGREALPLPEMPMLIGTRVDRLQHPADVPGAGGAGGGERAVRRAGAAAEQRGDARVQRVVDLLRADEVDVGVEAAGGQDPALAGDDLGAGADDDGDARLGVGVAGLADRGDPAVAAARRRPCRCRSSRGSARW